MGGQRHVLTNLHQSNSHLGCVLKLHLLHVSGCCAHDSCVAHVTATGAGTSTCHDAGDEPLRLQEVPTVPYRLSR